MKKKILSDVTISCDPYAPGWMWNIGPEAVADYYESWIREFNEFIRDHRSQDSVSLSVKREYQYVCSYCGDEWEEDINGFPICCNNAQEEYKEAS